MNRYIVNIDESTQGISNKVSLHRANALLSLKYVTSSARPPVPAGYDAADLHLLAHYLLTGALTHTCGKAEPAGHPAVIAELTHRLTE